MFIIMMIIPTDKYRIDCSRDANLEYWESTYRFVKGLHAGGRQEDAEL